MAEPTSRPSPEKFRISETGAKIAQTYLTRRQRVVAVNESDLRELLTIDTLQQSLTVIGIFMLSGSLWLGIEKILEQEVFEFTALIALCSAASIFGAILVVVGVVLFKMRRQRVRKIFSETEEP